MQTNAEIARCCDNPKPTIRDGQYRCTNCGTVIGKRILIQTKPYYTEKGKKEKKHTEVVTSKLGYRTFIGEKVDGYNNELSPKRHFMFKRLQRTQKRGLKNTEKNYVKARRILRPLIKRFDIPRYIETTAWEIYRKAVEKNLIHGRTIGSFVVASLYSAIRAMEHPMILTELVNEIEISIKRVHAALRLIIEKIFPEMGLKYKPNTTITVLLYYGNRLGVPPALQRRCYNTYVEMKERGMNTAGKDPRGIASALLYSICKWWGDKHNCIFTQEEIADIMQISTVTLRERNKELKKYVNPVVCMT